MKTDIILCGVGGQGILSIATIIGEAAMKENLYIKQAEVHGMSQRGGDVQSNLRISSNPISSDLIPLGGADVIISMEPMEALRYLPFLAKDGWIITSSTPFVNIPNYPSCWVRLRRHWVLNTINWRMPSVVSSDAKVRLSSRQTSRLSPLVNKHRNDGNTN